MKVYMYAINIIISAIIPRPRDHIKTGPIIKQINNALAQWCYDRPGFHFHPTYNSYQKGGEPNIARNFWCEDGLHLADRGVKQMNLIIKNLVALWRVGRLH